MERKLRFSVSLMIQLTVCCLVAAFANPAGIALGADKHNFAGQWNFNHDQSDDAAQKVREAEVNSSSSQRGSGGGYPGGGGGYPGASDPGGYPGSGYPGGGGGGMGRGGMGGIGGMGGMGGMGRGSGRGQRGNTSSAGAPNNEDLELMARDPKTLTISQDEKQIAITDDDGHAETLYPDGKKHKEEDSKTTVKSHWDGDRLIAESKLRSGKLTETYELSSDGRKLYVTSELERSHQNAPLVIRRVFDNGADKAK